jgi:hypothetical protein
MGAALLTELLVHTVRRNRTNMSTQELQKLSSILWSHNGGMHEFIYSFLGFQSLPAFIHFARYELAQTRSSNTCARCQLPIEILAQCLIRTKLVSGLPRAANHKV